MRRIRRAKKKSLILSVSMMLVFCLAFGAFFTMNNAAADGKATITVGSASGIEGDTVLVTVNISDVANLSGVTGISGGELEIIYDTDVIDIAQASHISWGTIITDPFEWTVARNHKYTDNSLKVAWAASAEELHMDGSIITITFQMVGAGTADLTVGELVLKDQDVNDIPLGSININNGTITVEQDPQAALDEATDAVADAEDAAQDMDTQQKIDEAQAAHDHAEGLVTALPASLEKTALEGRLAVVQDAIISAQEQLDYQAALAEATDAVVAAEDATVDLSDQAKIDAAWDLYYEAYDLVAALPDGADKTELANRLTLVNNEIRAAQALLEYEEALAEATAAVEAAEDAAQDMDTQQKIDEAQASHDYAADLVMVLPANDDKDDLEFRLAVVQEAINTAQDDLNEAMLLAATAAVEAAEDATGDLSDQAKIDAAQTAHDYADGLVAALPDGLEKNALAGRLADVQEDIDAAQAELDYQEALAEAEAAVAAAEAALADLDTQEDIDTAQGLHDYAVGLVSALDDRAETDELINRLAIVQNTINTAQAALDAATALEAATIAVEAAEAATDDLTTQNNINAAQAAHDYAEGLVLALDDSDEKDDLIDRLAAVQQAIDEAQVALDAAMLAEATAAVVAAEEAADSLDTQEEIDAAQAAHDHAAALVVALQVSDEKDDLIDRLAAVQQDIDEAQVALDAAMLAEATAAVEAAEASRTQEDVDTAKALVEALPDSQEKTALLSRLAVIQDELDEAAALSAAIAAVQAAEESRTQEDVDAAMALVEALPEGEAKTILLNRLAVVQAELDEAAALAAATEAVELAEETKQQADVDAAMALVEALPEGAEKDDLLVRLALVQAEIDAEDEDRDDLDEDEDEDDLPQTSSSSIFWLMFVGVLMTLIALLFLRRRIQA